LNFWRYFTLIAGVRYEKDNNTYNTYYIPNIAGFLVQSATISDTSSSFTDEHWLPNFHLRVKPFEWLDIRTAATKTLTRPDFSMRLPIFSANSEEKTVFRANPNLKTTIATNYDLNVSLYHKKYGLLSIGGFYKELDNVFYWINRVNILNKSMADTLGLPTEIRNFSGFDLTEPRNTSGTKLWGYEVDLQTNLRFLPGLLANLVLGANFTHINSETVYPRFKVEQDTDVFPPKQTPVFYEETGKLQGQPENFGNLALGYDYKGFSSRLTVFFQADYLTGVSANPLLDVTQKGFSKWDLSLKQRLSSNLDLFFNLINMTDVYEGQYYNFRNRDRGDSSYGMVADFGLRYSFF
jgi:TonB-dependent receptor